MPITKEQKREVVQMYADLLNRSEGVILNDNLGLSVAEMTELRAQIREAGGECHVIKNRLARLALEQVGMPQPDDLLTGPIVVGFAIEDLPKVAKAIAEFTDENDLLKIKGGLMGQHIMDQNEVRVLSKLPPLPVQRAQLMGLINTPAIRIAGLLYTSLRQILNVFQAHADSDVSPAAT